MRFLAPLLFFFLCSCASKSGFFSTPQSESLQVWDAQQQMWLSGDEAFYRLLDFDFVLLGETHGEPLHHRLQMELIRRLGQEGKKVLVGMEHLRVSEQSVVDELFSQGWRSSRWRERLNWEKSGWPEWELFAPLFREVHRQAEQLLALDLSREQLSALREGNWEIFEVEWRARHRLEESLEPKRQASLEQQLRASHPFEISEEHLKVMQRIQRARDAHMAHRLVEGWRTQGGASEDLLGLVFTGSGHVRKDWGLPKDFAWIDPNLQVLSIQMRVGRLEEQSLFKASEPLLYDWIWWLSPD